MPRSSLKSNKLKIWKRVVLPILAGLVVAGFFAFANPTLKTSVTAPIQNGLVGYWKLDENPAIHQTKIRDSSPFGNHGTLSTNDGTANKSVKGKISRALSFDGVDDYVDCGNDASLDITEAITIEAWIKTNTVSGDHMIVDKEDTWASGETSYFLRIRDDGLQFITWSTSQGQLSILGVLSKDTWYQVVATYDGAKMRIYLDGVLVAETAFTEPLPISDQNLSIGSLCTGQGQFFKGLIDEVRIYNRALSAEEVLQNYNASKRTYIDTSLKDRWRDGLVGYWTFDGPDIQGVNATATDVSGNGNDGTIYGAATTPGKVGQALSFDGVDDYVDCGNDASLDITEAITIEAWIKTNTVSGDHMIVDKEDTWASGETSYFLRIRDDGLQFITWSTSQGQLSILGVLSKDTWYQVVATYDGAKMRIYLDGVLVAETAFTEPLPISDQNLSIGSLCTGQGQFFSGLLDEVRIYNRALSEEEIKEHYEAGIRKAEIKATEL